MIYIGKRIKDVRKQSQATQKDFASKLGLSENYIWQIEKGDRTPSDRTIADICREFKVNELWLRTGEGEPYAEPTREEEMARLFKKLMSDRPEAFRTRAITALLRFDSDSPEWQVLERIYDSIADEAKK